MNRAMGLMLAAGCLSLVASCDPACVETDLRDVPRDLTACEASTDEADCVAIWDPVCGDDDRTYASSCVACATITSYSDGMCAWESGYNISSEAFCDAAGGSWGPVGLSPEPRCNLPTTDAGTPCTCHGQCQGVCVGEMGGGLGCAGIQGYCSEFMMVVGCRCYFDADGAEALCAD